MIKNADGRQASLALRSLTGSDGNDTFTVSADDLVGGMFDGAGGDDTLQLDGGSTFDLRLAEVFASIEIVRGSEGHDTIILNQEVLLGVTALDGGNQAAIHWDEVVLHGDTFDFRNKTLIGIDQLSLKTDNAVITVADAATALLVSGGESQNDRLVASNVAFSASQLKTLHQRGIDTIIDANGTHTNLAPVTQGLNGDRFEAKAGQRVFVDNGRNVVVSDDDEFLALLKVNAPLGQAAPGRMGIDVTGSVTLDGGYAPGSTIRVAGIDIGMLWDATATTRPSRAISTTARCPSRSARSIVVGITAARTGRLTSCT
jgi:serralysin